MSGQRRELAGLKVAIVHDWLYGGGAERVVQSLHELFPDAPIYTSYCSDEWRKRLDDKVVTGYLQRPPFASLRKFLPVLRMQWFGSLDFSGYDLVISSSGNGEAMGIKVPKGTLHVSYCHTPTHYYWRHYDRYLRRPGFGVFDPLARLGLRLLVGPLRKWDYKAAQGPDVLIANSTHIQSDIAQYYGRESVVIYPPIDTKRFAAAQPGTRHGFVTAGRQVPMKHTDIIVEACTRLNLPLTVIGRGPDHERLKRLAGPTVTLLDSVDDQAIVGHIANAEAFLFASYEDFGITPIEAMAAGTPVVAYKAGGALDYIEEGITGSFFAEQTVDSLVEALSSFDASNYNAATIRARAEAFSEANFKQRIQQLLTETVHKMS
jgi:glycosyltransferase involved in cell wall biosynthesis